LQRAEGEHFGRLGLALAKLEYRPALPINLTYLEQGNKQTFSNEFLSLISALGHFGGEESRQTLWKLLKQIPPDDDTVMPIMENLLQTALPEDFPQLVQYYRSLPRPDKPDTIFAPPPPISVFARSVQARRLFDEMKRAEGLWDMLEQAEWWLNADLQLSEVCLNDLEKAFDNKYEGVFDILLRETLRLFEDRGDDLTTWQTAWESGERPVGYRQRALYTLLILREFASLPKTYISRREQESVMGLALLAQLSVESDDQSGRIQIVPLSEPGNLRVNPQKPFPVAPRKQRKNESPPAKELRGKRRNAERSDN
jgi:hypothetical protein